MRRAQKSPIEAIGPGMIGALNGLMKLTARLLTNPCSTVPTNVVIRVDLSGPIAHDDHTFRGNWHQKIISGGGQIILVPDTKPLREKDAFLFPGKHLL